MKRVKVRIFSGAVCEQYVYNVSDRADPQKAKPRVRFENDEDRAAHRLAISQRRHRRLVNANFGPTSLYSTLTFSAEDEVHTPEECRRERDNFWRRLRRAYPDARLIIYYGRGRHTNRFHLHMISDGVPEDEIGKLWGRGSVIDVQHLREHNYYKNARGEKVDHGQDYTALADYLFGHWSPELGGHRWKATRNVREPEPEPPTLAVREYDELHPPVAPRGYELVAATSTRYGYQHFIYVRRPEPAAKKRRGGSA